MKRRDHLIWVLPAVTGVGFLVLWHAARLASGGKSWLIPTPLEILQAAWQERAVLARAVESTALGALGGFLGAAGVGFVLALVLGVSRSLNRSFYPWLLALQMTPVIVLAPVIVFWTGPGMTGVILVTFLISFFPIVVNTTQGLLSAEATMVDLFRTYGASRVQELWLLRVPAAMPYFLAGLRIAATLAPVGAIFGQYIVGGAPTGTGGLGFLVYSYNTRIAIPELFAIALTSCLLGFIFVAAVSVLNWAVLHKWHDSFERPDH